MQPDDDLVAFAREWPTKAEEDLLGAEMLIQSDRLLGLTAYHCQQAVEKALKGFLSLRDRPFRRTHNLVDLLRQCGEIDPAFGAYVDVAQALSPYASDLRYPGERRTCRRSGRTTSGRDR